MPNRLIRDFSEDGRIDRLSFKAEVFFRRLWNKADDFGRFYADPRILCAKLFPLKSDVRTADISLWLAECEKNGLIACYDAVDLNDKQSKKFLEIIDFNQQVRIKKSVFPSNDKQMISGCAADDKHVQTDCRPEEEVEIEEEKELEKNKQKDFLDSAERIWKEYPKKDGKKEGIKAILKRLKEGLTEEYLTARVKAYCITVQGKEAAYIKNAQGWFNGERYLDSSLDNPQTPEEAGKRKLELSVFCKAYAYLHNYYDRDYPGEEATAIMTAPDIDFIIKNYRSEYDSIVDLLSNKNSKTYKHVYGVRK